MTSTPVHETPPAALAETPPAAGRWSSERLVQRVVLGVAAAYALVVGTLALLRYASFASDFDHGIFSQYVWLLGHLHEPFNTIVLRTLLGDHVEPGIALLAPLGTVGVAAPGILVVQTLALAATAPLLLLLAREHGARGWIAAVPALLWCASPVVLRPALHDFHPETLVPVLLVGGLVALARERTAVFLATAVVACAMKEDVGLTYAALGLVLAWEGRRRLGGALAVATAAWSAFAVFVVLPAFGNAAHDEFAPRFAGDRGDSFADVVRFSLHHPFDAVDRAFGIGDVGILAMLALTTGGLCLLAPRWLLVAAPAAALNLLSAYDLQHTIDYHYWIVAAGAAAAAGAVGAGRVGSRSATWLRWSAAAGVLLGLLSIQWAGAIVDQIRFEWPRRGDRQAVLDAIPAGASVSAPMHALSHLAERRDLYVVPEPLIPVRVGVKDGVDRERLARELEYVVFDPAMKFWGAPTVEQVRQELERRGFRPVLRRGDTVLYRREPGP